MSSTSFFAPARSSSMSAMMPVRTGGIVGRLFLAITSARNCCKLVLSIMVARSLEGLLQTFYRTPRSRLEDCGGQNLDDVRGSAYHRPGEPVPRLWRQSLPPDAARAGLAPPGAARPPVRRRRFDRRAALARRGRGERPDPPAPLAARRRARRGRLRGARDHHATAPSGVPN